MVSVKKVTDEGDFIHVRFRPPSQFTRIRTPGWASRVSRSVSKGSKVRMGRTDAGNWFVQGILIRPGHGKTKVDAKRLAKRAREKIDE